MLCIGEAWGCGLTMHERETRDEREKRDERGFIWSIWFNHTHETDRTHMRDLPVFSPPRGLLLFLLGPRQRHGHRHRHRTGWLWLTLRSTWGSRWAPVSLVL